LRSLFSYPYKALVLTLVISLSTAWTLTPPTPTGNEPIIRLLQDDTEGLTLELTLPDFSVEQGVADGQPCQFIRLKDFGSTDTPGHPELPIHGVLLGIPPESDPQLSILEAVPSAVEGHFDICPTSHPVVEQDLSGEIIYRGEKRTKDPQVYALDRFVPEEPAALVISGYMRSQRIAKLLFQPLQYNPVSGRLSQYKIIRIRLSYRARNGALGKSTDGMNESDQFESVLRESLLNYQTSKPWRSIPQALPRTLSEEEVSYVTYPSYKLLVDQEGIYQVTYEDFAAKGIDFTGIDPHSFRLFYGGDYRLGIEQAISVKGEEDFTFDPGDRIIFYAQEVNTRYTGQNVYFLTWGSVYGKRMQVSSGTPGSADVPIEFLTTKHFEYNHPYYRYAFYPSSPDNDVWYWDYVAAQPPPTHKDFTVSISHISSSSGLVGRLRGVLKGYLVEGTIPNPQHHVRIYLNSVLVDEAWWPFRGEYIIDEPIYQDDLLEGTNTIRIELPAEVGITKDIIFVNWFEIDYWKTYVAEDDLLFFSGVEPVISSTANDPSSALESNRIDSTAMQFQVTEFTTDTLEVFDVTDPYNVVRIDPYLTELIEGKYTLSFEQDFSSEHRYLAQSLAKRQSPLDVIEDELSDLHALSSAQGADYLIITHSDFYTESLRLADHRLSPEFRVDVIKVDDVYDEFNGGKMDPQAIKVFLAYAYTHWQPPAPLYLLLVGDGNYDPRNYTGVNEPNYIPAYLKQVDPWLGEVAADNRYVTFVGGDTLPDMYLGRLPAKTSAQAAAMIDKILAYETVPPVIDWMDWRKQTLFVADENDPDSGNFPVLSNQVADYYLPLEYGVQKVYYKYNETYPTRSSMRDAIVAAINQGRLLVNYVGHGAVQTWGGSLNDSFFNINLIASLSNAGKLPIMVPMTCLEGSFYYPPHPDYPGVDVSSLSERMVREPLKGAIASYAPVGFGIASGHDYLDKGLFDAIFNHHVSQLGPAINQSKLYLYANSSGFYHDLIDTYALLGDPALRLSLVYNNYLPVVKR